MHATVSAFDGDILYFLGQYHLKRGKTNTQGLVA